ncbi:hypothetical protein [Sorangium cellulosum]|uniref:hypothetical protein n=1 Tax=Sorangium cellulosum TaxID=56 RepID=UPI001013BD0C|nr:hypothetical protein [Sorangium cellulosum]
MGRPSRAALVVTLALVAGCSVAPERAPRPGPPRTAAAPRAAAPPLAPARYVLTEGVGVLFDAAGDGRDGAPDPRPEPALYEGLRVRLEGGVVLAAAPAPEPLRGFRSIPARLGGGFVLWSEGRVYRAGDFLGELAPVADVGAPGGARPYLASILLRSDRGLLELDPATLSLRRFGVAGVADAVALDARRAARLDMAGRASVTLDAGATWIDVLETHALVTALLQERDDAVALLAPSGAPALHVTAAGLAPAAPASPRGTPAPSLHVPATRDPLHDAPAGRALAPGALALAAAAGALLPGGRLLVARDDGVAVLAAATARPLAEAEIAGLDRRDARCQPLRAGGDVLLACAHEAAHVLRFEATLAAPRLEATFPPPDRDPDPLAAPRGAFLGDDRGRLAFAGRCGSTSPGLHDFPEGPDDAAPPGDGGPPWGSGPWPPLPGGPAAGAARAASAGVARAAREDPAAAPVARVCVRTAGGDWIERRIEGDDARRLYRWIPGEGGAVTALVLEGRRAPAAPGMARARRAPGAPEGVRVIRARDDDPALAGGLFPAPADPAASPRLIDTDFWEDDDGAVRGWLHLPDEADAASLSRGALSRGAPGVDGRAPGARPRSRRRGGRVAGLRIEPGGRLTVFPLPPAVARVVVGGRFALAATGDDPPAFFESTDGGRSWRPVEGPPARGIEPPLDESTPFACSPIGCAMGDHGLVRLGWGGPPPRPRGAPPPFTPAASPAPPAPAPLLVSCRLEDDASSFPPAPAVPGEPAPGRPAAGAPPVVSLFTSPSPVLGSLRAGVFTADVLLPFARSAAPRRVSLRDRSLTWASGETVPVLLGPGAGAPADLLLLLDPPPQQPRGPRRARRARGVRAGAARPALRPFDHAGTLAVAAELPGGDLLAFDAGKRALLLATREATLPIAGLAPVSGVAGTRLTLARRLDAPGLALVGYSTASGEVFAGPLDLARAEVGPLEPLGSVATLGEIGAGACGGARPSHRFIADLPATLRVAARTGAPLFEEDVPATALLAGDRDALCVEALELRVGPEGAPHLGVTFGPGGGALLRGGGARLGCAILPDRP